MSLYDQGGKCTGRQLSSEFTDAAGRFNLLQQRKILCLALAEGTRLGRRRLWEGPLPRSRGVRLRSWRPPTFKEEGHETPARQAPAYVNGGPRSV